MWELFQHLCRVEDSMKSHSITSKFLFTVTQSHPFYDKKNITLKELSEQNVWLLSQGALF